MKTRELFLIILISILTFLYFPASSIGAEPAEMKVKSVTVTATLLGKSHAHIISYPNGGAYYALTVLARQTEVGLNDAIISLRIERDFSVAGSWKYMIDGLAYMEAVIDSALRAGEPIQFPEVKSIAAKNLAFSGVAWRDQQIILAPTASATNPAYIKTYRLPWELQSLSTPPRSKSREDK